MSTAVIQNGSGFRRPGAAMAALERQGSGAAREASNVRTSAYSHAAVAAMNSQPLMTPPSCRQAGSRTIWPSSQSDPKIHSPPNSA